ncbi:MAG TPA: MotA/TolQ/ExbB proton channel family protein [Candidatus Krumholzibacteria bacterium]|nr:MotA/TolQ/ExbB proton channel family protein [Candidatus Krumholzibacteria bacterium]HRX50921.1 MotA/TolQ/ExbB proton channel family protein [Candidatus Krumholzibacteria bacterium]
MDIATIIGVVGALGLIVWAILMGGSLILFVNVPSLIMVVGGTIMAILINYPLPRVIGMMGIIKKTVLADANEPADIIRRLVKYAEQARKEGMLALEEHSENEENLFLRKGLRLAVDGTDPALLQRILENDIDQQQKRHQEGKKILDAGGVYAPAFGMIGTLVGLVNMLANMSDPSSIGVGMAVALLTTFYGAVMANAMFIPMAGKLQHRSAEEVLVREMIIEGVMGIQSGDSPRIVEEKLRSFLTPAAQRAMDDEAA